MQPRGPPPPRFPSTSRLAIRDSTRRIAAVPPEHQQQQTSAADGSTTAHTARNTTQQQKQFSLPPIADRQNTKQPGESLLVSTTGPNTSMSLVSVAGVQNLATLAAGVLCDVSTRYHGNFTTQDQEVEQQRRAFFRVVEKVASEATSCRSAAVFCETLFTHVKQQIEDSVQMARLRRDDSTAPGGVVSHDDFAGLRIASACWALDVVSRSNTSFAFILQDIKRLIFPAMFVGYNAVDECCQQRARDTPAVSGSAALISSAPYLVCDLFYQRYAKDQRRIRQLNHESGTAVEKLKKNKSGAGMICRTLNRQLINTIFKAWRGLVRRLHVERFAREMLRKNGFRESRSTKLDASFSRWRYLVEKNHNATLTERCHLLTHQLENAKGQFQLQCFRADKYLRVVEELREELRGARDTREELHKENLRLQAQLEAFQVQARERLESHVSMLCNELHRWRSYVARQDHEEAERIDSSMKFCDRIVQQQVSDVQARRELAQTRSGGTTPGLEPLANPFGLGDTNNDSNERAMTPQTAYLSSAVNAAVSAASEEDSHSDTKAGFAFGNLAKDASSASSRSEAMLLQWCTWCVQQCPIASMKAVTNFSTDFISGEAIIVAMNAASPHHVSLALLQELHSIRRVERGLESGRRAGFTLLPKVQDFAEGTADLIVLAVSEIFNHWAAKQRLIAGDGHVMESSAADGKEDKSGKGKGKGGRKSLRGSKSDASLDDTANKAEDDQEQHQQQADDSSFVEDRPPVVTSQDLPKYLDECNTALDKAQDHHKLAIAKDRTLWRLQLGATYRAAYIARERQEGRSVTVLDRKDMIRFTKFQKTRFSNLQNRYRMPPLDYQGAPWVHFELQLELLRESLHQFYADLRRCFTYYCNGAPTMSGMGYWSFCNDIRVVDPRIISKTHLDRIFTMANLEDVSEASIDPLLSFEDDLLNEADAADEDENTETLLIPSEFVECLIRIADLRVRDRMLHDKFSILMRDYINPLACKSETDKFRREINSTSILAVTDKYRKDLNKVFAHFSHRRPGTKSKTRVMSVADFVYFAKESLLLNGTTIDEPAIGQIFENIASPTDDMSGRELLQHEFMDALVCISFYKHPSPFLPLEKKVELTCANLVSYLRGRLKGLVTLSRQQLAQSDGSAALSSP